MTRISVVGAGVSGLTTAIELLEAGNQVTIYSADLPQQTTSAVAAAIWFPYAVAPKTAVNRWSAESFRVFEELSRQVETGVTMTTFLVLTTPESDHSWTAQLPEKAVRLARPEELPEGYEMGYLSKVPLAETPVYIPYLLKRFKSLGGQLRQKKVEDLTDLFNTADIVVNCSGLGARKLCQDESLYPIRGQVLKVSASAGIRSMVDAIHKGQLSYIIRRENDIVLGGTDYDNDYNEEPSTADSQIILDRCRNLQSGLSESVVQSTSVGLRPKRPAIRCEKDPSKPIIHNYGHGGAGFTVSWGCAKEVVRLTKDYS